MLCDMLVHIRFENTRATGQKTLNQAGLPKSIANNGLINLDDISGEKQNEREVKNKRKIKSKLMSFLASFINIYLILWKLGIKEIERNIEFHAS